MPPITAWLAGAGQRVLQLLPLNEMAPGQQSPYSAISAMAIDPIFIRVTDVPEFDALGGEAALAPEERTRLDEVRRAPGSTTRTSGCSSIGRFGAAFERFVEAEWSHETARAAALKRFISEQAWWIEDYAIFRAIHAHEHEQSWTMWPVELQRREPAAIDRARRELAHDVLFQQYLQWLAGTQWQQARGHAHGVALFGDLPFMVDGDSADVWARQHQFRLDASVGVPPDAFSATGRTGACRSTGGTRWPPRISDGCASGRGAAPTSTTATASIISSASIAPTDVPKTAARRFSRRPTSGRRPRSARRCWRFFVRRAPRSSPEDLGTVPDFVRASLARLGVPGLPRVSMGAPLAHRRPTVPRSVRVPADLGCGVRHARHRAARRLVAGRVRKRTSRRSTSFRRFSG